MNESQLILLALFVAAAGAAVYFWRLVTKAEARATEAAEAAAAVRQDVERARDEGRAKAKEIEKLREQLQRSKEKLDKAKAKTEPKAAKQLRRRGAEPRLPEPEADPDASGSAAQVVHVSSRELEEAHRRALERLEAQLAASEARVAQLEAQERRRREDAERAAAALAAAAAEGARAEAPEAAGAASPDAPEARIEALERDLAAVRRAATEAEQGRRKEIKRLELRLEAAHRRAANDHAAYQVIKGHLEIAEDRLATLRRRYEGAKSPEELAPRPARGKRVAANGRPGAKGEAKREESADPASPPAPEISHEAAAAFEAAFEATAVPVPLEPFVAAPDVALEPAPIADDAPDGVEARDAEAVSEPVGAPDSTPTLT